MTLRWPLRQWQLECLEDRTMLDAAGDIVPHINQPSYPLWVAYSPPDYDPNISRVPSLAQIGKSLDRLYADGTRALFLYTLDGPLSEVPRMAKARGFETVVASIFYYDRAQLGREKAAAVLNARHIDAFVVGVEGLLQGRYTRAELELELRDMKALTGRPVTTVEPAELYLRDPTLAQLGDWVFPTIHPWYANIRDPIEGVRFTVAQYEALRKLAGTNRWVSAAEAWWPSGGGPGASEAAQATFYARLWAAGIPAVAGEAFAQPWKAWTEGPFGPEWSLYDASGGPKAVVTVMRLLRSQLTVGPAARGVGEAAEADGAPAPGSVFLAGPSISGRYEADSSRAPVPPVAPPAPFGPEVALARQAAAGRLEAKEERPTAAPDGEPQAFAPAQPRAASGATVVAAPSAGSRERPVETVVAGPTSRAEAWAAGAAQTLDARSSGVFMAISRAAGLPGLGFSVVIAPGGYGGPNPSGPEQLEEELFDRAALLDLLFESEFPPDEEAVSDPQPEEGPGPGKPGKKGLRLARRHKAAGAAAREK